MAVPSELLGTVATIEPTPLAAAARTPVRRLAFARWVTALAVLALLVRVIVVLATANFTPIADSITYDRMSTSVADHGVLPLSAIPPYRSQTAFPTPLFAAAMAIPYRIVGTGSQHRRIEAARLFEALLGAMAVLLICLITARLFDRRVALLAGGLAAIYPPLVLVGSSLMSEALFIPLLLGATLCALVHRSSPHRLRWALATGVLIGLTALTRGNGIALVLPLGLLVWSGRPPRARRALIAPVVMVLATLVVLAPWSIRNLQAFHQFVPITTESGYALAGTYSDAAAHNASYTALWTPPVAQVEEALAAHPQLSEAQLSDALQSGALHYIAAHPAYPLEVAALSSLRLFNLTGPGFERWSAHWEGYLPGLAYWSVFAFWLAAGLALLGIAFSALRRTPWAVWGVPLVIILSAVPFAGLTRYRSPADPFFVILAAFGLFTVLGRLQDRRLPSAAA